jgi:hypothetical protein
MTRTLHRINIRHHTQSQTNKHSVICNLLIIQQHHRIMTRLRKALIYSNNKCNTHHSSIMQHPLAWTWTTCLLLFSTQCHRALTCSITPNQISNSSSSSGHNSSTSGQIRVSSSQASLTHSANRVYPCINSNSSSNSNSSINFRVRIKATTQDDMLRTSVPVFNQLIMQWRVRWTKGPIKSTPIYERWAPVISTMNSHIGIAIVSSCKGVSCTWPMLRRVRCNDHHTIAKTLSKTFNPSSMSYV